MLSIHLKRIVSMIAVLFSVFVLVGCGGSPVQHQWPDEPETDPSKILAGQGIIVSLKTEKLDYKQGEPIRFWFSVKNQGTKSHTIELRPWYGKQEGTTYWGNVCYYGTDMTLYDLYFRLESTDRPKYEVAPGAEVRLVEIVWDQKTMQGTMAQPGFYDLDIRLFNVYIDGHLIDETQLTAEIYKNKVIKIVE